ncbi:MAG: tRNA (cytidine(34)-2'-O)-methyltransferase [Synechococcaceae cyanobacterium]|nr:tRNA (cytidine(34)-2'-O)-methyltransferase [Synechococcaceae cyanobacterium]
MRVVLFQPEIPPNTGNVARTCAATETELHLIEPLGFTIDDRQLRRAGLDYWVWVNLQRHPDFESLQTERQRCGGRLLAFTSQGGIPYTSCRFRPDDWLLFGRESEGLPASVIACADERLTIPMARHRHREGGGVRSLNLSVSVAVGLFEALRQIAAQD